MLQSMLEEPPSHLDVIPAQRMTWNFLPMNVRALSSREEPPGLVMGGWCMLHRRGSFTPRIAMPECSLFARPTWSDTDCA